MRTLLNIIWPLSVIAIVFSSCGGRKSSDGKNNSGDNGSAATQVETKKIIELADPTIFYENGTYYLTGTGAINGFLEYSSTDLKTWKGPVGATDGLCLSKGDSWGQGGFWAPQVVKINNKFCMIYVADEQLAVAYADSPTGPFRQSVKEQIPADLKEIDPFLFFDDDGKVYMYHVRLTSGNEIWVAEMNEDMKTMNEKTAVCCIRGTEAWENTAGASWAVTEGPTVVKLDRKYYMMYSANDFRNIDYSVGLAIADSPKGPWKKLGPFITRKIIGQNGTGHGDLFKDKDGNWQYVFHTHQNSTTVSPRKTAIVQLKFEDGKFSIVDGTFRYLMVEVNPN